MNLERLQIFLRLTEARSQAEAARLVHLTQPAVSRNLRLLEDELGVRLFERRGRSHALTAAGRALVPRARAVVADAERARREVQRTARRDYYDVRIGTVDSIATFLFPKIVESMLARFPELGIKLTTGRSADLLDRLSRDELDLVIVAWSGTPPAGAATEVSRYDLHFYGRRDRFPGLARARTAADLQAFPIVQIEALPGQPTLVHEDAPSYAVAASLAAVKALVLGGFGVGALLSFMLSAGEKEQLARARIPHDPRCALFVVGDMPVIKEALVAELRRHAGGGSRSGRRRAARSGG